MINIIKKEDCCGCNACVQKCPKQCISMNEDSEGFLYPEVDASLCIDCGLCEKVCPVINQSKPQKPLEVYAAKNPNEEVRMASSSGGIFSMLAEEIINKGGVVFGAKFNDNWEVVHDYAETMEGVVAFRGSKYVQSVIGENFILAEKFLKEGREVLFSGTPCQIAGLNRFLNKEYPNLLTVDVVCHGVPSPLVWRDYLNEIKRTKCVAGKNTVLSSLKEMPVITGISFRDKSTGWKKYGFVARGRFAPNGANQNSVLSPDISKKDEVLLHETFDKNIFMQGFLRDLYLRPSCHACPSKSGKSQSDITIADFWGIEKSNPQFNDDDMGVGLLLIQTSKGMSVCNLLKIDYCKSTESDAILQNPAIKKSVRIPDKRKLFWQKYGYTNFYDLIETCSKYSFRESFRYKLIKILFALGIGHILRKFKINK